MFELNYAQFGQQRRATHRRNQLLNRCHLKTPYFKPLVLSQFAEILRVNLLDMLLRSAVNAHSTLNDSAVHLRLLFVSSLPVESSGWIGLCFANLSMSSTKIGSARVSDSDETQTRRCADGCGLRKRVGELRDQLIKCLLAALSFCAKSGVHVGL
jgi:hypothetical protein